MMFTISVSHGGEVEKVAFHVPCDGEKNTGETFLRLLLAIISEKFDGVKMAKLSYKTKRDEVFTIGCDDELRNALLHYDASLLILLAEKEDSSVEDKENEGDELKEYIPTNKAYPKAPLTLNTISKEVKKLQTALEKMNFLDKKTMDDEFGTYGPDTAQALRKFRGGFAVGIEGPRNTMYTGEVFDEVAARALEHLAPVVKSKPVKK